MTDETLQASHSPPWQRHKRRSLTSRASSAMAPFARWELQKDPGSADHVACGGLAQKPNLWQQMMIVIRSIARIGAAGCLMTHMGPFAVRGDLTTPNKGTPLSKDLQPQQTHCLKPVSCSSWISPTTRTTTGPQPRPWEPRWSVASIEPPAAATPRSAW